MNSPATLSRLPRLPLVLTRASLESAAGILEDHYEPAIDLLGADSGGPNRSDYGYAAFHLAREIRLNLCDPAGSFIPGRSLVELQRLAVFAKAATAAFEAKGPDCELLHSWETLLRGLVAAAGPRATVRMDVAMADRSSV